MKRIAILVSILTVLGNVAMADDSKGKSSDSNAPAKLSIEQRQKMAGLHEKMATCLRSERPMVECRKEMMTGCKDTMGKDGCPMMGGKKGHGMHRHMMHEHGAGKE